MNGRNGAIGAKAALMEKRSRMVSMVRLVASTGICAEPKVKFGTVGMYGWKNEARGMRAVSARPSCTRALEWYTRSIGDGRSLAAAILTSPVVATRG
jgi:hypothetical protein